MVAEVKDLCGQNGQCCSEMQNQLQQIDAFIDELAKQGSLDGKLIAILHKAQEIVGYLPDEVQAHVARRLSLSPAKVFGVVTFYSYFSRVPRGKYAVDVCMGTACFVVGADAVLEECKKVLGIESGGVTDDHMFSLNALRCVGACGLAPLVLVNGKLYGRIKVDEVKGVLESYKEGGAQ